MWDIFISHASEDKEVARPLATELEGRGYRVWYDEFELKLGDSLRRSIDEGLAHSRFGLVILSRHFMAKEWTQRELDGLTSREIAVGKVILPVWHGLTRDEIIAYSPVLADRLAANTSQGIPAVAEQIVRVLAAPSGSNQAQTIGMSSRRLSINAERILAFTIEAALKEVGFTPEVEEVMEVLGLTALEYANAVEELEYLDVAVGYRNGNHASSYSRARIKGRALIEYSHLVAELPVRADLEALLRLVNSMGQGRQNADELAARLSIPLPRLQLLFDYLEESDLAELKGSGQPGGLEFFWVELTAGGRRVAQGLDPLPIVGSRIPAA